MRYLLILLLMLLAACTMPKPAPDSFEDAEQAIDAGQAIDAAVRAGAEECSPVELRFAREKLAEAHKGMEVRQYDKSIYLIEQSEINSELAIEKCKTAAIRARVAELSRENEVLREDFLATFGEEFE
jgi:hypothetical protein